MDLVVAILAAQNLTVLTVCLEKGTEYIYLCIYICFSCDKYVVKHASQFSMYKLYDTELVTTRVCQQIKAMTRISGRESMSMSYHFRKKFFSLSHGFRLSSHFKITTL